MDDTKKMKELALASDSINTIGEIKKAIIELDVASRKLDLSFWNRIECTNTIEEMPKEEAGWITQYIANAKSLQKILDRNELNYHSEGLLDDFEMYDMDGDLEDLFLLIENTLKSLRTDLTLVGATLREEAKHLSNLLKGVCDDCGNELEKHGTDTICGTCGLVMDENDFKTNCLTTEMLLGELS